MTPAQQRTLDTLKREGFALVVEAREVIRVTRNGDNRVILRDGSQKRGHHVDVAQLGQGRLRKG